MALPFYTLTFFDKCGIAFRTPDLDASLASWNPDFLPADRAWIDVVGFSLLHQILQPQEKGPQTVGFVQVPLVFRGPPVNIPGEHPEIRINEAGPGQGDQNKAVSPSGDQHGRQTNDDQAFPKRVYAIPSIHELH